MLVGCSKAGAVSLESSVSLCMLGVQNLLRERALLTRSLEEQRQSAAASESFRRSALLSCTSQEEWTAQ